MRAASRRYRERNLEKERERDRAARLKDPEAYRARKRKERRKRKEENPELERQKTREKNARHRDAQLAWQEQNKDKCRKATREHMQKNKERYRDATLRKLYGISAAQYDVMFRRQKGNCAICGKPEVIRDHRTKELRRLAIDHDANTGFVRGLLCYRCNTGIGRFEHSLGMLKKAQRYLEVARERQAHSAIQGRDRQARHHEHSERRVL